MNDYTITTFEESHLKQVTTLFNLVFDKSEDQHYLHQKYFKNDINPTVFSQVAFYNNEAVSFCGLIPQQFGNKVVGHSCDYFTHPDHRGSGLVQQLFDLTIDNARKYGMPNVIAFFTEASFGAVKQRNWEKYDKFLFGKINASKLPINKLLPSKVVHNWQWKQLLRTFKTCSSNQIVQPPQEQQITDELRTYKSYSTNEIVKIGDCVFWLKLDSVLMVGWAQAPTENAFKNAIEFLQQKCSSIGVYSIYFQVSEKSTICSYLRNMNIPLTNSWNIGLYRLKEDTIQHPYSINFYNFDTF
jgi:GNAT superfamily N-acetyltransferase